MRILSDSLEVYLESLSLIAVFGFLVFAVMLFFLSMFSYSVAGAGFLRYSDVLTGSLPPADALVFAIIGVVSLFAASFLSTAVTMVVKLRRSLDDIHFTKLLIRFPGHVIQLMVAWGAIAAASFLIGLVFSAVHLPAFLTALAMLFLWAFFIFLPQTMILHEQPFVPALGESVRFCLKKPLAVAVYYVLSVFLLVLLLVIDVALGQTGIFWLPRLACTLLLFLFVIPYLEVLKANLYLTRYGLLMSGLK